MASNVPGVPSMGIPRSRARGLAGAWADTDAASVSASKESEREERIGGIVLKADVGGDATKLRRKCVRREASRLRRRGAPLHRRWAEYHSLSALHAHIG
jgi:hypothetical protein